MNQSRAVVIARMLHRVSASVVGLLAIGLLVFGWNGLPPSGRVAAVCALLISAFLAWLGRYTPHPIPWVTIGNVGGGFALIAAFSCVAACRGRGFIWTSARPQLAGLAIAAGALLAALLWLGLMIGARDAIPACPTLLCLDGARFDLSAFDPALAQANASTGSGQALHLAHRFVALAFALVTAMMAWRLWLGGRRALAALLAVMLAVQIALGLTTAAGVDPVVSATLHNVVAALWTALLAALALQPGVGTATAGLAAVDQRDHAHHDQNQAHQAQ
ncbi:MAG TPA: COX15/CtaA family protein [Burkholderiaceae bacterium]|nr:COX15/CtaA family protein [Burkholderiaceae bacterium]